MMKKKKTEKEEAREPKKVAKTAIRPKAHKPSPEKKTKAAAAEKKIATKKIVSKAKEQKLPKNKKVALGQDKGAIRDQVLVKQATEKVLAPEPAPVKKTPKVEEASAPIKKAEIKKEQPVIPEVKPEPPKPKKDLKPLELDLPITVKDLSAKIQEKSSILIKYLIEKQKMFVTINQSLSEDIVIKTLYDFGFELNKKASDEELLLQAHEEGSNKELLPRPPVITLMGHVDHGKTSLLDAIRRSKIVDGEHGGITQHMGAYEVETEKGKITFLDTPGHEAFTAMRSRGANITDIVILVVAADDGVMPQTVEAIDHARAAKVPIVVAINKIDKPNVDLDKVKKQLSKYELMPEDWGGQTVVVGVSAKDGQGIATLLEMILLEAEMLELKSIYDNLASGVIVEARMTKGQGSVVTVLVQSGTLKAGDNIICGQHYGKIKAMINDLGQRIDKVTPGVPAEILGFLGLPQAGEKFYVLNDEKKIKVIVEKRQAQTRQRRLAPGPKHISLEDLYSQIQKGVVKDLNLIIKADVQGSLEAIKESLAKLISDEVKLNILHSGIGPINSSDVILAEASNAIIIGFHVTSDGKAKDMATEKNVEIRTYRIIYELISEIKAALEGLLAPKIKKNFIGKALVRKIFNLTKSGLVAGCMVQKGKITRQATMNLTRNGEIVYEGTISALKRFKDDVKEVQEGFECGISLAGFTDYKEGDMIEAYTIEKIARTL